MSFSFSQNDCNGKEANVFKILMVCILANIVNYDTMFYVCTGIEKI